MAILEILHFPDPRLRTKAKPVEHITPKIKDLVEDMFDTMYHAPGIGLAATQINVHRQIIVIDVSETKNQRLCLINPRIVLADGNSCHEEGCLSVPDIHENIIRAALIQVQALDINGKEFNLTAEGLLATCIQHEIDHLNGKLFVDYLSPLKRQRIAKKLAKTKVTT